MQLFQQPARVPVLLSELVVIKKTPTKHSPQKEWFVSPPNFGTNDRSAI